MGTNGYKRLHGLTVEQQNAIDRLVAGDTDEQAAKAAGVHRVTVSKWRLYDPMFQAALNARRQEVWGASADKLRSLVPRAFDTLTRAMGANSVVAAAMVLKAASLDKLPPPTGPTDPEQLFEALVEARLREKRAKREHNPTASGLTELSDAGWWARKEAEDTAAAKAEIEAEIEARLNDDAH